MNTEELNALKDRAYKTAVEHGFHEEEKSDAYWLGLVMSEAGEAINADLKGRHAGTYLFTVDMKMGIPFKINFENHIKDSVEDEIADIVIRLFDFAGLKGYELRLKTITQSDIEFLGLGEGFVADLFNLVGGLSEGLEDDDLELYVCCLISIFSDRFDEMTGSNKGLWWFVEQKMRYNELRPKLNGKMY